MLQSNGLINSIYLSSYGILVLLFFFAAILALRVNISITRNEQLAQAIRALNEGVAIFDSRDQAVIWNDAYQHQLSTPARKILRPGRSFIDLVKADAYSGELPNAIGRETDYISERLQRHQHPEDAFEVERSHGWYLYREAKTPDGGRVTLAANLSSQKAKEAELQVTLGKLMAANEAKNSFLANMSHELRTPLNAINGFSEMMTSGLFGPLNDQYQEYAGHISRAGKHLLRLVIDMLDVARIESGKLQITPELFSLPVLLEDCFHMEAEKFKTRKLNVSKMIPDEIPPLYADPVRVRQIILNLLDNAIKFTDAGGDISVNVEATSRGGIVIKVSDTGIGMTQEHIKIALQKFGQVRENHLKTHEGLGLGLSIAKIFMELHGGSLELQSQLGEGTTVTLTFLPLDQSRSFFENQTSNAA